MDDTAQPGSLEALREGNRRRVVGVLREHGTASRADIARITGLSRSTVSSVVSDLMAAGLVREGDVTVPALGGSGRPAVPIFLDPSAGVALGLDIAHDGIRVAVADLSHTILEERWGAADVERLGADAVLDLAARTARAALDAAGAPVERLIGAAASVASPVDPDSGVLGGESVVQSIAGHAVGQELGDRLGFDVRIENDANLCAVAEHLWGAARGHDNAVYVKLSRGIGAGLIIGGRLHRGMHGGAGEIGHTPIQPDGPPCHCGNRGCVETFAGTEAVLEQVRSRFPGIMTIGDVVGRAIAGDTVCRRALRDAGTVVGTALGTVCNLLNPSLVVLGGEMVEAWRFMEVPLREAMDRGAIHSSAAGVDVVPSALGTRGEVLGAIGLVLRESGALAAELAAV
jgi:predicted NBD/HSP70 family sugar kinase